jgi:hypothetical protein
MMTLKVFGKLWARAVVSNTALVLRWFQYYRGARRRPVRRRYRREILG